MSTILEPVNTSAAFDLSCATVPCALRGFPDRHLFHRTGRKNPDRCAVPEDTA